MADERGPLATRFARQVLLTTGPFLSREVRELTVLDVGCGYGHTARELAAQVKHVVGIEPSRELCQFAQQLQAESQVANLEIRHADAGSLTEVERYDLVVLDNVLEHIADQRAALQRIVACLRPGGVLYVVVPNKLWPIEPHYFLPFLSYLPVPLANVYLRITRRGRDYTDASYAPTYFGLRRLLRSQPALQSEFVLPADVTLTTDGGSWLYRTGVAAIRRFPQLWAISKAFLVVGVKQAND